MLSSRPRVGEAQVKRLIIGVTGASGAAYAVRTLEALRQVPGIETHLVMTGAARQTIALETDHTPAELEALADHVHGIGQIAAPIASGSFQTYGMLVVPCSMKSLAAIAYSLSDNLLLRAADVVLKERKRLVLMIRETPLHLGHLRAMVQATELGAIVMPAMPAFYHRPKTVDDIINQTVNRALDLLGIELPVDLFKRWGGPPASPAPRRRTSSGHG
ncbi:MAG: UbiX family flavin prenyltransferase [Candidatus Acidiferrales bacterium]